MRILISLLLSAGLLLAQVKAITKQGLVDALNIGGLTQAELVSYVRKRGVDFRMTATDETDLRNAGAAPALLQAVRESYRSPAATPPVKPQPRGAPPAPPPPPRPPAVEPKPAPEPPPADTSPPPRANPKAEDPPQTPRAAPKPAPRAAKPAVDTLAQVRRIFIDDMPENLDEYIRAEIHKQLAGRLVVVLTPEAADAIMTGVSEQREGTGTAITGRYLGLHDTATGTVSIVDRNQVKILWSEEAGDRSLLFGAFRRGGARRVASRLIGKLKKVL